MDEVNGNSRSRSFLIASHASRQSSESMLVRSFDWVYLVDYTLQSRYQALIYHRVIPSSPH